MNEMNAAAVNLPMNFQKKPRTRKVFRTKRKTIAGPRKYAGW